MVYYVFDIGQIPPYNRTFDLRKRKLKSPGWMEIETKERVFHLRKDDIELYCDDTSLGFLFHPIPGRRSGGGGRRLDCFRIGVRRPVF